MLLAPTALCHSQGTQLSLNWSADGCAVLTIEAVQNDFAPAKTRLAHAYVYRLLDPLLDPLRDESSV